MGLPAPDQEKAADLLNPLVVVDLKEAKDCTVESCRKLFAKKELPAFMVALKGAGLNETLPKELSSLVVTIGVMKEGLAIGSSFLSFSRSLTDDVVVGVLKRNRGSPKLNEKVGAAAFSVGSGDALGRTELHIFLATASSV